MNEGTVLEREAKPFVQYIRKGHRRVVGCVVALDHNHIGFSLVHTHDQKENGKRVAIAKKAVFHFAKVRADQAQVVVMQPVIPISAEVKPLPYPFNFMYLKNGEMKLVPYEVRKILNKRFHELLGGL